MYSVLPFIWEEKRIYTYMFIKAQNISGRTHRKLWLWWVERVWLGEEEWKDRNLSVPVFGFIMHMTSTQRKGKIIRKKSPRSPSELSCGRVLWCTGGSSGKESTCQFRRSRFNPRVGKFPWRRKWQLQSSCLENPTDRGAWQATAPGGTRSWTRLSNSTVEVQRLCWQKAKLCGEPC